MVEDFENMEEKPELDDWEDIIEPSPFAGFISETPVWLYATVNSDIIKLWHKNLPFFLTEFVRDFNQKVLDSIQISKYSVILRTVLRTEYEASKFIDDAKRCGIYIKQRYSEPIPERGVILK